MRKIFKIEIVPQTTGKLQIPFFSFEAFDPRKENYYSLQSNSPSIEILPSDAGISDITPKKPIEKPVDKIQQDFDTPLHPLLQPEKFSLPPAPKQNVFWMIFLLSFPLIYLLLHGQKLIAKINSQDSSERLFSRTLKEISSAEPDKADSIVRNYFTTQLNCSAGNKSIVNALRRQLGEEDTKILQDLENFFRNCENIKFASNRADSNSKETRSSAKAIVKTVHQKLPKWKVKSNA